MAQATRPCAALTGGLLPRIAAKRLLVFDFDGVLADSVEIKTEAFAEMYHPFGADVVARVVAHHRSHGGMSRFDKLAHYHRAFLGRPADAAELRSLAEQFSALVLEKVVAAPEIPGARRFVERWGAGRRCDIVSATPQDEIAEIVRRCGLGDLFAAVYGSPATKADNLRAVLAASGVAAREALFFGDSAEDARAAAATGIEFLAVNAAATTAFDGALGAVRDFLELC